MTAIKKFEQNSVGRDFVVGDIHGCYDLLMAELSRVQFNRSADRLFSVGDLVDRGPDSMKCLGLPFEPWFHAVRGNHEMLMIDGLKDDPRMLDLWLHNGGAWIYNETPYQVRDIAEAALERMPYAMEVEVDRKRVGIVHAEVPGNDWSVFESGAFCQETAVWGRTKITQHNPSNIIGIDAVVCGHTIVVEPIALGNQHYIDTGAFHTGRLTLRELRAVIDDRYFHQSPPYRERT